MNVIQESQLNKTIKYKPDNISDKIPTFKPSLDIDDLLNEKGELKHQEAPAEVVVDKELNEKLDNLMKDLRGRTRKFKFEFEAKEESKEVKPTDSPERVKASPKKIQPKSVKILT
mmetsp:Transcript_20617/g.23834  ORF Transcript_20617/g.23834 Transcript_20617/m.23834 type:complete len:115 (+) Transcript_20617:2529-2873(+)